MSELRGDQGTTVHGVWGSRWTFILAATGSAVGLGNIWKFPYIAGENGGGAFVLVYLACILVVGIPVMMAEVMLGRMGRMSPINTMSKITQEVGLHGFWKSIGWLGVIAGLLILSYYAVIAGWALHYIFEMGSGRLQGASAAEVSSTFSALLSNPKQLIIWQSVFMVLTLGVVIGGVTKGLGVAVRFLMPLLFVLLVVMLIFSAKEGNLEAGIDFMFSMRFESLTWEGLLVALGHSFFTLSLGMGAIMAYGAYMPAGAPIGKTVITIGFLDTLVALMAGLVIFPIVFANPNVSPGQGPGLMFETLPLVFGSMPGGLFFGSLFFVLVSVAAWSSSISLVEPAVAWMIETLKVNRVVANLLLGAIAWVIGLGSVLSFNRWQDKTFAGETFFGMIDFLTSSVMLPLTGLLIALVVGWLIKPRIAIEAMGDNSPWGLKLWHWLLAYVSLVAIGVIFVAGVYNKFFA
jgi:neurotransmitter:Na+ symporter, NSS family